MSSIIKTDATVAPVSRTRDRLDPFDNVNASTRALLALDAGRMGCWSVNLVTEKVLGDRFFANLLGLDYDAQPWPLAAGFGMIDPVDLDRVQNIVAKAISGETPTYDVEYRRRRTDPSMPIQWLGARAQITEWAEDGTALRAVGVSWDATEQKVGEEKLAVMAAEMDHRVKNAFAVIRALINLGDRTTDSKDEFVTTLRSQVEAMSMAHAVSARMARTTADADSLLGIHDIIVSSLKPWLTDKQDAPARVHIDCDPALMIHPRKVSPLAMVLYEISTNATKYGPLSTPVGEIHIAVTPMADDMVRLVWSETSDTRDAQPEAQSGFGTVLLENCAINLGGTVTKEMKPQGLHLELLMNVAG